MTMPSERTRAVLQTKEFLKELSQNTTVPEAIKREAWRLLRHYPDEHDLQVAATECPERWGDPASARTD